MYKLSTLPNPHDALTAASSALSILSKLIGERSELSINADDCYGLSALFDVIHHDMSKVAKVIESDRKSRDEHERSTRNNAADEYQRGFGDGIAEGRRQIGLMSGEVAEAMSKDGAPMPKLTEPASDAVQRTRVKTAC